MARLQRVGSKPSENTPAGTKTKGGPHGRTGRPTKYDSKYCDQIIEYMCEGNSLASFCAEIRIARSTLDEWANANADFSVAKKEAVELSQTYWEAMGHRIANGTGPIVLKTRKIDRKSVPTVGLDGQIRMEVEEKITETYGAQSGNTGAWVFNMINRFPDDWRQRQEIAGPKGGAIPVDTKLDFGQLTTEQLRELQTIGKAAKSDT